jgi:hypothetical protein
MGYRAQPYGPTLDSGQAAAQLDVPEGESLGFGGVDPFRVLAGGAHVGDRPILSDEAGALGGKGYNTTWSSDMLPVLDRDFAGRRRPAGHPRLRLRHRAERGVAGLHPVPAIHEPRLRRGLGPAPAQLAAR